MLESAEGARTSRRLIRARQGTQPSEQARHLERLSGQRFYPVIEFEDGRVYRAESKDMAVRIRAGQLLDEVGAAGPGCPCPSKARHPAQIRAAVGVVPLLEMRSGSSGDQSRLSDRCAGVVRRGGEGCRGR